MSKGHIIFLNGVSSSGKSTLAKALVKALPNYFHFSVDCYDDVINSMEDRENGHLIPIDTEYFFHQNVAMFSNKGVHLVVDHLLHNQSTLEDWFATFKDYPVLFVGVHCPLEELERRERERGDRAIGQSRAQLAFVHQNGEKYDVEVDTYAETTNRCVEKIINKLQEREALQK